jgi:hypothetical protein
MASGFEKSPDYGGPEPRWPTLVLWLTAVAVIVAAFVSKLV